MVFRRDDAHRDDELDAVLHRHGEVDDVLVGHEDQEPGGGVGSGRDEYVDQVGVGQLLHFALGGAGDESHRINSLAREFHQDHFAERFGVGLGDGGHHLFGAGVESAHHGDAVDDHFTELNQLAAEETFGQYADHKNEQDDQDQSQAGQAKILRKGGADFDQRFDEPGNDEVVQKFKQEV